LCLSETDSHLAEADLNLGFLSQSLRLFFVVLLEVDKGLCGSDFDLNIKFLCLEIFFFDFQFHDLIA